MNLCKSSNASSTSPRPEQSQKKDSWVILPAAYFQRSVENKLYRDNNRTSTSSALSSSYDAPVKLMSSYETTPDTAIDTCSHRLVAGYTIDSYSMPCVFVGLTILSFNDKTPPEIGVQSASVKSCLSRAGFRNKSVRSQFEHAQGVSLWRTSPEGAITDQLLLWTTLSWLKHVYCPT